MARTKFTHQLDELDQEITHMGMLCETIISRAMQSLFDENATLANSIPDLLDQINQDNQSVESIAMRILLQQQPVASDLRYVSSVMKIVTDMRRIGIQGGDIAEIVTMKTIKDIPDNLPLHDMSDHVISMVSGSIDAFIKRDEDAARSVIAGDDVTDDFFDRIKMALIKDLREGDAKHADAVIDLLMIAKYLERIADHAVHISGWACYAITGKREE